MTRTTTLIAALTVAGFAAASAPILANPTFDPPPPPASSEKKSAPKGTQKSQQKKEKQSDEQFLRGYRHAYAMIQGGDYAGGIAALHALGEDDHPDVANYVGYAYRKLGSYENSKIWYERALASDPKHTRTWQYYGLWHLEQGNKLKAQDHLETIRVICGTDCGDYRDLKSAIESGKFSY